MMYENYVAISNQVLYQLPLSHIIIIQKTENQSVQSTAKGEYYFSTTLKVQMGEVQSSPASMNRFVEDNRHLHKHTLMEQICEDIASGNEGDILDMQCKMLLEHDLPHLWESHETLSTRSDSSSEHDMMEGSPSMREIKGPLIFERNMINKSKTIPRTELREGYHKERMEEFMDEDMFRAQLMKSQSAPMEINGGEGALEIDSYEEFIMKLVE